MTTLKNFQSEIEEIHARERVKQRTQAQDIQRREAPPPSVLAAGNSRTIYDRSGLHSSEQERQILVTGISVVHI